MKNHYKTLDVADGASLLEIKKAYKKKAQLLHPDRNPSANAHEQFIELNTAYQHLIKEKTNDKRNYNRVQNKAKEDEEIYKKAQAYAKMRYEEYINSEEYKELLVFHELLNLFIILLVFGTLFVPLLILQNSIPGLIYLAFYISFIVIFFMKFPLKEQFKKNELYKYLKKIFSPKKSFIYFSAIFNLYGFFYIGFRTLIPMGILFLSYALSIGLFFLIEQSFKDKRNRINRLIFGFSVIPLILSFFLFLNYTIPISEKEKQTYEINYYNNITVDFTKKELNRYAGSRLYLDSKAELSYASHISYTFQKGLFGINTIKKREIHIKENLREEYEENRPKFSF